MRQFFKNWLDSAMLSTKQHTARTRANNIDRLMDEIKDNAISVTPVRYSNYIEPRPASTWTTITEIKPRPFYRAARPAKRWKK